MTTLARPLLAVGLLATVALASACADAGDGPTVDAAVAGTEIAVLDNDFEPEALEVSVGDIVTWTWNGNNPHDVSGEGFASEIQRSGTFAHTFEEAGEFPYVCTLHRGMRGLIVVTGA